MSEPITPTLGQSLDADLGSYVPEGFIKHRPFSYAARPDLASLAGCLLDSLANSGVCLAEAEMVLRDLPRFMARRARLHPAPHSA